MIDWTRISKLREDIGAEDFAEVVELFIEEVTESVDRLRADGHSDTLGADLHALKGAALNLGFTDFSGLCEAGEILAAKGAANDVALPHLLDCYDKSRQAFLNGLENGALA